MLFRTSEWEATGALRWEAKGALSMDSGSGRPELFDCLHSLLRLVYWPGSCQIYLNPGNRLPTLRVLSVLVLVCLSRIVLRVAVLVLVIAER